MPVGIYVVEQPVGESVEEQVQQWKYMTPDVSNRDISCLNETELQFFEHHLPTDCDLWEEVVAHNLSVTMQEYPDEVE